MTTTNTSEPQNYRAYRRLRAWEMHQQGYRQQAIADALGLTQGAVSQSLARARAGGVAALQHHKPQGAKPRLPAAQKTDLLISSSLSERSGYGWLTAGFVSAKG